MYIQPVLNYCNEVLITAADGVLQHLETFQNQALRIITGGVKTTPILAMQLLTGIQPITNVIDKNATTLYNKLTRLPTNSFWREYNYNQRRYLKTQRGFIQAVRDIDCYGLINDSPSEVLPIINPLEFRDLDVSLNLNLLIKKSDYCPEALRAIALETIEDRYPSREWLHVFTDGSLLDFCQGAGAGIYCELFCFYQSVGNFSTHFDGELEAIFIALQQLAIRQNAFERAVILSDSTSALQALSSNTTFKSPRILQCRSILAGIQRKVNFQWIPSHCGVEGNEKADFLAKRGCSIILKPNRRLPFHSSKLEINRIFRDTFRATSTLSSRGKPWSVLISSPGYVPCAPRAAATAAFRLLTGHDCLRAHLFRIGIADSPLCSLCTTGQRMTAEHLDDCPALLSFNCTVEKYWRARSLMT